MPTMRSDRGRHKKGRRLVIGVTGGIASGKTEVMRELKRRGIPTVSGDTLAHRSIRRGQHAYGLIVRHFGPSILDSHRQINRKRLGAIVFSNPKERKRLEGFIHPRVIKALKAFVRGHRGVMALDIPLLFETRLTHMVDKVVVVTCRPSQQIQRLQDRNGLSRHQAMARIHSQLPLAFKRTRADYLIDNTSSRRRLRQRVRSLLRDLSK